MLHRLNYSAVNATRNYVTLLPDVEIHGVIFARRYWDDIVTSHGSYLTARIEYKKLTRPTTSPRSPRYLETDWRELFW